MMIFLFFVCMCIIVYASMRIANLADLIEKKKFLSQGLVGFLLMSLVTSAPELFSTVSSAFIGNANLALSNIFGSNITNLFFLSILNIFSLTTLYKFQENNFKSDLSNFFFIIFNTLSIIFFIALFKQFNVSIGIYFIPIGLNIILYYKVLKNYLKFKIPQTIEPLSIEKNENQIFENTKKLKQIIFFKFFILGIIIFIASVLLAYIGDYLSQLKFYGITLGGSFIGFLFLSFTTSLPELISSLQSIRLGNMNLALANIYGSNLFNLLIYSFADIAYLISQKYDKKSILVKSDYSISILAMISIFIIVIIGIQALSYKKEKKRYFTTFLIISLYIFSIYISLNKGI